MIRETQAAGRPFWKGRRDVRYSQRAAVPSGLTGAQLAIKHLDHGDLGTVNQAHTVKARLDRCPLCGARAQEETKAKDCSE